MRRRAGFSMFELAVAVTIIAVVATALLTRLTWYQQEAERAEVEHMLGVLRAALGMKAGQLIANGQRDQLSSLLTLNPMDLLAQKPSNYAGEVYAPQMGKITAGNWYFNRKKLLLVYITRTGASTQTSEKKQYQYRIELIRHMEDANGLKPAGMSDSTTIEGVTLRPIPE